MKHHCDSTTQIFKNVQVDLRMINEEDISKINANIERAKSQLVNLLAEWDKFDTRAIELNEELTSCFQDVYLPSLVERDLPAYTNSSFFSFIPYVANLRSAKFTCNLLNRETNGSLEGDIVVDNQCISLQDLDLIYQTKKMVDVDVEYPNYRTNYVWLLFRNYTDEGINIKHFLTDQTLSERNRIKAMYQLLETEAYTQMRSIHKSITKLVCGIEAARNALYVRQLKSVQVQNAHIGLSEYRQMLGE